MPYQAVIFDLFGTLVDNFSLSRYDGIYAEMANAVAAPYADFRELFGETYRERCLGVYTSIEDNIKAVCRRLDLMPTTAQIERAATHRYRFIAQTLTPEQQVLETLGFLKREGFRLGLISDCGPDVPFLWNKCPLAALVDAPVFSCQEGRVKPHIELYQKTARQLGVFPQSCVYVGDGSSQELTGATAAGFLPILRRIPLEDVYDKDRIEANQWQGRSISEISELPQMLQGLRHGTRGP